MKRKSYPDDCECSARDRRTCQQACKPTRDAAHRKHIKENRGGRDDRPAGTPGATPTRRRKPVVYLDIETRYDGPPGVKLMQGHSPAVLAGVPGMSMLMGPDEYVMRGAIDQIKVRQAAERVMHNGWYTHGCGQWVHDQFSPCSVCPRPRRPRKKK